jgi:DNA-binding transcriptional LysR family regulator
MTRYLCAAPAYLARRGVPKTPAQLLDHDAIELPSFDGRPRTWTFTKRAAARPAPQLVTPVVRMSVNEALTIHRLVLGGAGLGVVSAYVCSPDIAAGRLVRLLPDWQLPALDVSAVFPSHRELSPAVRAFVDFITSASRPGLTWQSDLLVSAAAS